MRQMWRRALRARVLVYAALLLAVGLAMVVGLWLRTPFKVDVVRDRGALARIVPGGMLENVYRLQIMNATESSQRYRLGASGIQGLHVASEDVVQVEAAASRWVAVRLRLPYGGAPPGSQPMRFDIEALDSGQRISEKSVFIVPR